MGYSNEEHRQSHRLRVRFERHRSLVSAWEVLAASSLSGEKYDVSDAGRGLGEDLLELASRDPAGGDSSAVSEIDSRLDELEAAMRASALRIPVHQLRSMLPRRVRQDRQGLLDLLDLLLGSEVEALEGVEARIAALDYVITLLCIGGSARDAAVMHDPVTLTPRLAALCARSDLDGDPAYSEVEAEFFVAADLYEADAGQKVSQRSLRRRKAELGCAYFVPRVLRAIVTYNSARLRGIDEEVAGSRERASATPAQQTAVGGGSGFEDALAPIGSGSHEVPVGCVGSFDDALDQEVNGVTVHDRNPEAFGVPEPQAQPAFAAPSEASQPSRAVAVTKKRSSDGDDFGRAAEKLAREALEGGLRKAGGDADTLWQTPPAGRVAWGLGVVCAVMLAALALPGMFSNSELAGYSRGELEVLSPHLSSGARNLDGGGPAFVGTMYDNFFTRSAADQTRIAADLVASLRATGVNQIMIYDGESRLRIQALGSQTVRVLSSQEN